MATTTATFASSLVLPSLNNPKTLSFHNPRKSLSLPLTSSSSVTLKLQSFHPFSHFNLHNQNSTRFVRNVAVSSDFEEELLSGEEEPSFSEDLKLFVGNLPFDVDSAQLAELFKNAGNVEMVEVIYDKITGRSRGFGFVTMSTPQEVEAAAQQFNGYELDGRSLRVNYGPPPQKQSSFGRGNRGGGGGGGSGVVDSSNRVYVGNLSWGVDNLALESLFSEQGKVLEAKVVYDRETGRSRGFGFVSYGSSEEVDCAIESLNGVELDGRTIRVSVAEARPPRRQF